MSLIINDKNYFELKKVFEILIKYRFYGQNVSPEIAEILQNTDPIQILTNCEIENKKIAKLGLKAGLIDAISDLKEIPKAAIILIDNDLKKNNLPSINKLLGLIRDTHKKVLKNKKIQNIEQYYIIKELVIDLASEITEQERVLLESYINDFEVKQVNLKKQ